MNNKAKKTANQSAYIFLPSLFLFPYIFFLLSLFFHISFPSYFVAFPNFVVMWKTIWFSFLVSTTGYTLHNSNCFMLSLSKIQYCTKPTKINKLPVRHLGKWRFFHWRGIFFGYLTEKLKFCEQPRSQILLVETWEKKN